MASKRHMLIAVAASVLALLQGCGQTEEAKRLEASNAVADPWLRYQTLNHGWSVNAWATVNEQGGYGFPSKALGTDEEHVSWAIASGKALEDALKVGDADAVGYVCQAEADNYSIGWLVKAYCPSLTVRAMDTMLRKSREGAANQGEALPKMKDVVAAAKRYGAKYETAADAGSGPRWVFPSVAKRLAFEREALKTSDDAVAASGQ